MSENEFLSRVLESELSANARLVCFVLLRYRNRKNGDCFPSQETISHACGLCRSTIVKSIQELEKNGWVELKKKRSSGKKFTSTYYIFPFHCLPDIQSNTQSNSQSFDVSNDVSNDVVQNTQEPNKPNKPKYNIHKPENVSEKVWQDFIKLREKKKAPLTESVLSRIEKQSTLAKMSLEDALMECCDRGWASFKAEWIIKTKPNTNFQTDKKPQPKANNDWMNNYEF